MSKDDERKARLAKSLRDNLHRRKAQARALKSENTTDAGPNADDAESRDPA